MKRRPNLQIPVSIPDGGTGATSAAEARTNLGLSSDTHSHSFGEVTGVLPVSQGGTGSTTAAGARQNLGAAVAGHTLDLDDVVSPSNLLIQQGGTGRGSFYVRGTLLTTPYPGNSFNIVTPPLGVSGAPDRHLTMNGSFLEWREFPPANDGVKDEVVVWTQWSSINDASYAGSNSQFIYDPNTSTLSSDTFQAGILKNDSGDLNFKVQGSTKMRLTSNSAFLYSVASLSGAQLYRLSSSSELHHMSSLSEHKENIHSAEFTMDDLLKMRPVEFDWKPQYGGGRDIGLIAEEIAEVNPLSAEFDDGKLAGVKYNRAWLPAIQALKSFYQEAERRKTNLLRQIEELEQILTSTEAQEPRNQDKDT